MPPEKHKILCIEDDKDTCELITFVFSQEGYEVEGCSQTECLNLIRKQKFSAIILDNYLGGPKGIEICREIRSYDSTTPIIFFSGAARRVEIDKALAARANDYLVKTSDFEISTATVINRIERCRCLTKSFNNFNERDTDE